MRRTAPTALMRSRRSWLALTAVAVVASALPALGATPKVKNPGCELDRRAVVHTATATQTTKGTWIPCRLDTGMTSGEVGLVVTGTGTLMRSVATNPLGIAVSTNKGATWQRRVLPANAPDAISDSTIDPVTGRYFYVGAGPNPAFYSDDLGKTWHTGTFDSKAREDWSKIFVGRPLTPRKHGYPNNIYFCNWATPLGVVSATQCFKSIDGGNSFHKTGPTLPVKVCPNAYLGSEGHGRGVVDPSNGWIYLPVWLCGHLQVDVSKDEGLSWTDHVIKSSQKTKTTAQAVIDTATNLPYIESTLAGKPSVVSAFLQGDGISDALGMDAKGRLYAVWTDMDYLTRLATSVDHGVTWSKAKLVTPKGVKYVDNPGIAVTKEGRVGISYYGSTDDGATWDGYLAVTTNARDDEPVFQTSTISRPGDPIMDVPCCWANGSEEYTAPRWGPDGSLYASFAGSGNHHPGEGFVGRLMPTS